jgi:hypothetical protein
MKKILTALSMIFISATMFAQESPEFKDVPNVVVSSTIQGVIVRTNDKCIAQQLSYSSQVLRSYYERGERIFILEKDRYAYAVHFVASASNFACNPQLSMKYDLEKGYYYEEVQKN